jgi:hypothetical protein
MAIRIENSLLLMVNGRSNSVRLLKHLAAKGKPEKAPKIGKVNRQEPAKKQAKTGKETGMSFV